MYVCMYVYIYIYIYIFYLGVVVPSLEVLASGCGSQRLASASDFVFGSVRVFGLQRV